MASSKDKLSLTKVAEALRKKGYSTFSKENGIIEVYIACHAHPFEENEEDGGHWQSLLIKSETERVFGKETEGVFQKKLGIQYTTGDIQKWVPEYEPEPSFQSTFDRHKMSKYTEFSDIEKKHDDAISAWKLRQVHRKERQKKTPTYNEGHDVFQMRKKDSQNFHDAIWLPDCGGDWYHMQKDTSSPNYDIDPDPNLLSSMLISFRNMLKDDGGYIYLGKILGPNKLRTNMIQEIKKLQPSWKVTAITLSQSTGEQVSNDKECYHELTDCVYYIKIECSELSKTAPLLAYTTELMPSVKSNASIKKTNPLVDHS